MNTETYQYSPPIDSLKIGQEIEILSISSNLLSRDMAKLTEEREWVKEVINDEDDLIHIQNIYEDGESERIRCKI